MQWSCKAGFHHSFLTSCHPFSKADGEIIFPLVWCCYFLQLWGTDSQPLWTVTGSKAITHKRQTVQHFERPAILPWLSFILSLHVIASLPSHPWTLTEYALEKGHTVARGERRDEGPELEGVIPDCCQGNGAHICVSLGCLCDLQCNTVLGASQPEGQTPRATFYLLAGP